MSLKLFGAAQVSRVEEKGKVALLTVQWQDGKYPQELEITIFEKQKDQVLGLQPGEWVEITGSVRKDKYEGRDGVVKYFTKATAYKIELLLGAPVDFQQPDPFRA